MATRVRNTHFILALVASWIDSIKRTVSGGGAGGAVSGTSAATTPAFTGTASGAAEVNAFTGTGFATAGQVVTTTDNQTMTLNQCAGMWLITATQPPCLIASNTAVAGAPAVLTVYGLAPTTNVETYRILKAPTPAGSVASHTHGAGSFAASPASSAVHYDRGEYAVTAANATSLATSLTLVKSLLVAYATHRVDALAHDAADTTNTVASAVADVVDLASAITAANQLKAAYNAHLTQGGVHPNDDVANAVVAADASSTQGQLNTLANALKVAFNAHIVDGFATPSWRIETA